MAEMCWRVRASGHTLGPVVEAEQDHDLVGSQRTVTRTVAVETPVAAAICCNVKPVASSFTIRAAVAMKV
jgi:hypothetical protein